MFIRKIIEWKSEGDKRWLIEISKTKNNLKKKA